MATVTDDFERANENLQDGANWATTVVGNNGLAVNSNSVWTTFVGLAFTQWDSAVNDFGDDQYAQCECHSLGNDDFAMVATRYTDGTSGTCYYFRWDGRQAYQRLYKFENGTSNELEVFSDAIINVGDVVKLSATGQATTNLKVEINANTVAIDYDDSTSPLLSGQPALGYQWDNSRASRLDNFEAGDIGGTLTLGAKVEVNYNRVNS